MDSEHYYSNRIKQTFIERLILLYRGGKSIKDDFYAELLYVYLKNLNTLQDKGCPKFTWQQPNAKLPDHPGVENFLKSDRVTFVYWKFDNIDEAKQWIDDNEQGGHLHRWYQDYSFTGIARENQGIVEVILQKERVLHDATKEKYFDLAIKIKNLERKLTNYPRVYSKLTASSKRPSKSKNENCKRRRRLVNED